ncbi:MAG TPA: aldo/keto reductase [Hyphomicrobiaceae bacterium]|nr:aldo/keto reductase [Hyphomicrobiaceae bacterium]
MERRRLGKTGLEVSLLGFGCGTVSGLMVRGTQVEQDRAVHRAIDLGITYFDTAAAYGDGASERNLGRALRSARADLVVATKIMLTGADAGSIAEAVVARLEASLRRLGRECVDIVQLHNRISTRSGGRDLAVETVLGEVAPAFARLIDQGKARYCGLTALGDTDAIGQAIDSCRFDTVQVIYNMLNPSAAGPVPPKFPGQDFAGLLDRAKAAEMGILAIRVLAAGALSPAGPRHPLAKAEVDPMGSGSTFAADIARARRLEALVREGHAGDLNEAAIRFAVSCQNISSAVLGFSSVDQLEAAVRAVEKGPLSAAALERLRALQSSFVGEPR